MTIAGKINTLVISVAVTLATLMIVVISQREYQIQREHILDKATTGVLSQPDLQLQIYYRDKQNLTQFLDSQLESRGVTYASLHETATGNILLTRERPGELAPNNAPSLAQLRSGIPPLDEGTLVIDSAQAPAGLDWLGALLGGDKVTHLTIPVLAVVNPNDPDLTTGDFSAAMASPQSVESVHIIAYLHLAISRLGLLGQILPFVSWTFFACLLVTVLSSLLALRTTRKITAPLTRLAKAADLMASGQLEEPVPLEGSGEVRDIANILNGLLGGLSSYKTKMDVDHQLLSMKVEERNTQLTKRNE